MAPRGQRQHLAHGRVPILRHPLRYGRHVSRGFESEQQESKTSKVFKKLFIKTLRFHDLKVVRQQNLVGAINFKN